MKALIVIGPILLVGAVLGAGFTGMINIPGVTPKKPAAKAAEMYGESKEVAVEDAVPEEEPVQEEEEEEAKPVVKTPEAPKTDPEKGAKELAKYWSSIETTSLLKIIDSFEDNELALVLSFMSKDKVAEVLSKVAPERAAKLSKELQRLASIVRTGPK